jgi:hypothetical protein
MEELWLTNAAEQYQKETNELAYLVNSDIQEPVPTVEYIEWLENKIEQPCNTQMQTGACKKDPRLCLSGDDNCFGDTCCPEFEPR